MFPKKRHALLVGTAVALAGLAVTLQPTQPAPAGAAPRGYEKGVCALDDVAALEFVPADAFFVAVARDVADLADRLGRERVVRRFREQYEEAAAEVSEKLGHDLLDPKNLPKVGIDPNGQAGFVFLDMAEETFGFFVTLRDKTLFQRMLREVAEREHESLTVRQAGGAVIIHEEGDSQACFIIRGSVGFLIGSDRSDEEGLKSALLIAGLKRKDSLAADPTFREAVSGLGFGRDAAAYLNAAALLDGVMEVSSHDMPLEMMREQRDRAVAEEVDPETRRMLEEQIAEFERMVEKEREERGARAAALRALVAGMKGLALGVELDGAVARMKMRVPIEPGSIYTRAILHRKGVPAIVEVLDEPAVFLVAGRVEPSVYLELFEKMAEGLGKEPAALKAEFLRETGLDVERDIVAALSGEYGGAITADVSAMSSSTGEEVARGIGGAVLLGLTDAAKGRALLNKLASMEPFADEVKRTQGRVELVVPNWRTVYAEVVDTRLVVTTDPGLFTRVAKGKPGSFLKKVASRDLRELLTRPDPAALWSMDLALPATLVFGLRSALSMKFPFDMEMPRDDHGRSAAYRAKREEIEAARAELSEVEDQRHKEETEIMLALVQSIGTMALHARLDAKGMTAIGGQYLGEESVPVFVERLIDRALKLDGETELGRKKRELQDKVWRLGEELRALEEKDAARPQGQNRPHTLF